MPIQRLAFLLAMGVLAAAVTLGVRDAREPGPTEAGMPPRSVSAMQEALSHSPLRLRALYRDANELLPERALRPALRAIRGWPAVVNLWASWCGPCRAEFGILRAQAVRHGDRVAFLGVNVEDGAADAREYLATNPLPYPSVADPDSRLASGFGARLGLPATVYLDRAGKVSYVHYGQYRTAKELEADITRYALPQRSSSR